MRRSRRPVLVRLALAGGLVGGSIAGCGDGEGADETGSTVTAVDETTASDDAEAAATTTAPVLAPLDDQTPPEGTNGIRVAADGTLWIADLDGGQIVAVDPSTGALLARFGADAGVTTPDDLAFDADGRLWWTEFPGGAVGRIDDPTDPDATSEVVAEVGTGANPIAIDDEGRVFVGRTLQGRGLYELDPTAGDAPREVSADPGVINGFDVGRDGRIVAPVSDTGQVVAIDPETGEVEQVAAGLAFPVSVRWAPEGDLVVLSGAPAAVTRVDPDGGALTPFATPVTAVGDNMAFDADGTLYVTGFDQPTVSVVAADGTVTELAVGST